MKETIISVTAIICLTVLGVLSKVESVIYPIAVIIGGIAGFYIPQAVNKWLRRIELDEETKQKLSDAAHVIGGTVAGCACPWYPGPSIAALIAFGVFEWWQAREIGNKGSHDFWGGVLGYFIGLGIVLILTLTGVI